MSALIFSTSTIFAVARGYQTDDDGLRVGMVVSLDAANMSKVERTTSDNQSRVIGVVTMADNSSVTVAKDDTAILVESEGEVELYVSDLNGPIKKGDLLAASPIKGILVKAKGSYNYVVAIATNDASQTTETHQLDNNGKKTTTKISKVAANLNRKGSQGTSQKEPSTLVNLGKALTGKDVSEARVVIALILFVIVLIAEGGIIYGAVSSSITALGRNPLAQKMIRRELLFVSGLAIGVLGLGLGAVYMLLWL